eukprot:327478_1
MSQISNIEYGESKQYTCLSVVSHNSNLSQVHVEGKAEILSLPLPLLCNTSISECDYLKELQIQMKQYEDDDTIHGSKTSDIQAMLDNFGHLMQKHNYNKDNDIADEFETIYNALGGHCDIATCEQFKRHNTYRDHTSIGITKPSTNLKDIYGVDDDIDVTHKQIVDKIHCFYRHCYDIGNRLNSEQNAQRILSKTEDDTFSVFKAYQKTQGIHAGYHARYKKFTSFGGESKTEPQEMFSVGTEFCYFEKCLALSTGKAEPVDDLSNVVPKKYYSFKEELTHNNVAIITAEQFDNELAKSKLHMRSRKCKQWMSAIKAIQATRITRQIQLFHILSLMIYCNFTHLSAIFSATYRQKTQDESMESILIRHSSFFHLGKYLREVVRFFGTKPEEGDVFYRGIDAEFKFPRVLSFKMPGPVSTTTIFMVAVNFAREYGSVLTLTSGARRVSVSWLSDFGNEHEHLFLQSHHNFSIKNIHLIQSGIESAHVLRCIKQLMESTTYNWNITMMPEDQTLLKSLIGNELHQTFGNESKYKKCERLSKYEGYLFHQYCINVERLRINKQRIYCDYFMVPDYPKWDWVDLNVICALYPNIKYVCYDTDRSCVCKYTLENIYMHFKIISNKGYSKTRDSKLWNKLVHIHINCNKTPLFSDFVNKKFVKDHFKQIGAVMRISENGLWNRKLKLKVNGGWIDITKESIFGSRVDFPENM